MSNVGKGTSGQILQAVGTSGNVAYSTATFPSTAGTSGNVLTSDGTNWSSSATTSTGTWTPTLSFGGATTGITYTTQLGNYVKIGKLVFLNAYILLSSKGSATGVAAIDTLPFATLTQASLVQDIAITPRNNITYTGLVQMVGRVASASTSINVDSISTAGAQAQMTDAVFTNTSSFVIQGVYMANS